MTTTLPVGADPGAPDGLVGRLVDVLPEAVVLLDERQQIVVANDRLARLLGRPARELHGLPLLDILEGDPEASRRFLALAAGSGSALPGSLTLRTASGPLAVTAYGAAMHADGRRWIVLRCMSRSPASNLFRELERRLERVAAELHRERRLQSQLQQALRERETLLNEVHHRVRNNLQVVLSSLSLQMRALGPGEAYEALREAQARIRALALVHNQLYGERDLNEIDVARLLSSLCSNLATVYESSETVDFHIDIPPWPLHVSRASPLALLVTEAVSNAIKHAFPGDRSGTITLEGGISSGSRWLRIADNGVGMGPAALPLDRRSVGLELMRALADQLGARFELKSEQGVEICLHFEDDA
jgi:two-component sensor histidine kinase